MTAFLALGRLTSHPGLETGLRARFSGPKIEPSWVSAKRTLGTRLELRNRSRSRIFDIRSHAALTRANPGTHSDSSPTSATTKVITDNASVPNLYPMIRTTRVSGLTDHDREIPGRSWKNGGFHRRHQKGHSPRLDRGQARYPVMLFIVGQPVQSSETPTPERPTARQRKDRASKTPDDLNRGGGSQIGWIRFNSHYQTQVPHGRDSKENTRTSFHGRHPAGPVQAVLGE